MTLFTLLFLLGDLFFQSQHISPNNIHITLLLMIGCISLFHRRKYNLILAGFIIGYSWTAYHSHPVEMLKASNINGTIISMPAHDLSGTHFDFKTKQDTIRLTWNKSPPLQVGDEYNLFVKLKRIHGAHSPGALNMESLALSKELVATGSVIGKKQQFIKHHLFYAPVESWRQSIRDQLIRILPKSNTANWLLALTVGDRNAPQEQWKILSATGTNHLMAIAGLHIGLVAGFIYMLVNFLWRRHIDLIQHIPAHIAASTASLLTAWIYSAMAGFSLPTQRACWMITCTLGAILVRRQLPAWHAWSLAMLIVLIVNPHQILSPSFWLSFGTLALIIFGMYGRLSPAGIWWHWGRVQWVIGFGLIPFSLLFFQETSLISFIANSIAIPWLAFLILPFCLLSVCMLSFSTMAASINLWLADQSLSLLWLMLTWFAHLPLAIHAQAISYSVFFATTFACILLLLPIGTPGKWLGFLWFLPLLTQHPATPKTNEFWVTILDVGQGLSVLVQTEKHNLLYDAGPNMGSLDAGENIVKPYLIYQGIKIIDSMIISHGDNDHIGGAGAVMRHFPIHHILTSAIDKIPDHRTELCITGQTWQWDGVTFSMLYPDPGILKPGNDSSCVLKISNGKYHVLLTGDIEKFAEDQLLNRRPQLLKADLITAPHHGSKTSSQLQFIQAIKPRYVVFATGYQNRYGFPHALTINHYQQEGVLMQNTVETGTLQFKFTQNNLWYPNSLY